MSLPTLLKTMLAALAGWTLLRLTHRVSRLEVATGVWRVAEPTSLAPLSHVRQPTDEEYFHVIERWRADFGRDAA
jgi:hypothetical protein